MDPVTSAEGQLRNFADAILSVQGVFALSVFLLLLVLAASVRPVRWVVLALLLYASTLGSRNAQQLSGDALVSPLRQIQSQGRGITGAMLVLLLAPAVMAPGGWRRTAVPGAAMAFLVFQLVFSARFSFGGHVERSLVGGVLFVMTFVALGWGCSKWLQSVDDVLSLLRAVAFAATLLAAGTALQLLVNPSAIIWQGRLSGTTGNAQHAATAIALTLPVLGLLIARPAERAALRVLWAGTAALLLVFLIWTGSRTGTLLTVIGVGVLFRRRLGKFAVVTVACGVLVVLAMQFFTESTAMADRLMSLEDTRSRKWGQMFQDFLASPAFGRIGDEVVINENSYLATGARFGLLGLIPLAIAVTLAAAATLRLRRLRPALAPEPQAFADLSTGVLLAIAAGGMFEGYLVGTLSLTVFLIYVHLSLVAFLTDLARTQPAGGEPVGWWDGADAPPDWYGAVAR